MDNVTTIAKKARPVAPKLSLVECPDETIHRVACMLKYLARHPRDTTLEEDPDVEFARFLILNDLADALEYVRAVQS